MRHGVVAFLDVLGYKGIWKRDNVDEDVVIKKMSSFAEEYKPSMKTLFQGVRKLDADIEVISLSDSIVIMSNHKNKALQHIQLDGLLEATIIASGFAATQLLEIHPYMTCRGCITIGSFEYDKAHAIIAGKAIDEAASLSEIAEGPFIWLAPAACDIVKKRTSEPSSLHLFVASIPTKYGTIDTTRVRLAPITPHEHC
ncbi:MAG: hypothetical protein PHU25_17250 [Deltaproteobacteria bacterium]|nr:hypothetical protein [Deltaproteobacteria bacterium]